MKLAGSYFKALTQIGAIAGLVYLFLCCLVGDPVAIYLILCSILTAIAGPIALSLQKDTT